MTPNPAFAQLGLPQLLVLLVICVLIFGFGQLRNK
jgi:Sec-independent protein translocase protein TatA